MIDQYGGWIPDYPGQQPYQDPAYMRARAMPQQGQQQQQQASRMVEAVQVQNEKAVMDFPVGAGATKIFLAADDSFLAVKSVTVAGQVMIDMYDKRPPAQPTPEINPSDYVRKDEIGQLIEETIKKYKEAQQ